MIKQLLQRKKSSKQNAHLHIHCKYVTITNTAFRQQICLNSLTYRDNIKASSSLIHYQQINKTETRLLQKYCATDVI